MSWIVSNWVERRAARERHLRNASELWRSAQASIAGACDSLHEYYADVATVRQTKQNDNAILIAITQTPPLAKGQVLKTNLVSIEFEPEKAAISVAVDGMRTQEFPIDADPDHAFITRRGHEVLLDEFSRLALEEAFFSPPAPKQSHPHNDPDKALDMARELIRTLDKASDARMEKIAAIQNADEKNAA